MTTDDPTTRDIPGVLPIATDETWPPPFMQKAWASDNPTEFTFTDGTGDGQAEYIPCMGHEPILHPVQTMSDDGTIGHWIALHMPVHHLSEMRENDGDDHDPGYIVAIKLPVEAALAIGSLMLGMASSAMYDGGPTVEQMVDALDDDDEESS